MRKLFIAGSAWLAAGARARDGQVVVDVRDRVGVLVPQRPRGPPSDPRRRAGRSPVLRLEGRHPARESDRSPDGPRPVQGDDDLAVEVAVHVRDLELVPRAARRAPRKQRRRPFPGNPREASSPHHLRCRRHRSRRPTNRSRWSCGPATDGSTARRAGPATRSQPDRLPRCRNRVEHRVPAAARDRESRRPSPSKSATVGDPPATRPLRRQSNGPKTMFRPRSSRARARSPSANPSRAATTTISAAAASPTAPGNSPKSAHRDVTDEHRLRRLRRRRPYASDTQSCAASSQAKTRRRRQLGQPSRRRRPRRRIARGAGSSCTSGPG